ncbi:hypothetical protein VitviT2T_020595 [Vitis vinifera]|uniref:Late embryogenesis abundant protein LEA-2 subgroup domain-containing protein n=2 Tax=Vitis vinifera TaxID=29760 RepID=F6HBF6_VITVI|nr:uncharacterized protein LOC100261971 [Vitis vinifera]RVX02857.1 hypothetical protein CK203_023246 [Vitis vinifera]WKA02403.1 hypothetical protein VitviT2T_020595 [Vitis vinifera]|eukprot:XP_002275403.1 PREDICTED: uncharacterized protein LOC100261971 [Vitis vinifera]
MEGEDQALFHAYPCAYYVQSPSTLSRANSADCQNNLSTCHSPLRSETFMNNPTNTSQEVNRFSYLSRYSSSSRGSNNSFLHEKKIVLYDAQSQGTGTENGENGENRRRMSVGMEVDGGGEEGGGGDDEEEEYYYGRSSFSSKSGGGGWWRYFSFRTSSSCLWICLQISWRLMVSLGAALLVFCIATKPPPPMMSIKMTGIRQFGLGEGVDASGVTTKILTCNCSMALMVDNKSKLFGLHIHPPLVEISFDHHPFATSHGQELYAPSHGSSKFQLYVGTRNKPMYGAGRAMQDMLETGEGLPLAIRVSLKSSFRVVWSLIVPKFHHQAECLLFLNRAYDKRHGTQVYNSTCTVTS